MGHVNRGNVNKTISMVNIGDEPVTIRIGGTPGDGATEYTIGPGEAQSFHENYCKAVPGAGPEKLPSILARRSMRAFPDGVRRPVLVPAAEAKAIKAKYAAAVAAWTKNPPKPVVAQAP